MSIEVRVERTRNMGCVFGKGVRVGICVCDGLRLYGGLVQCCERSEWYGRA